jgi:hypothetical protein
MHLIGLTRPVDTGATIRLIDWEGVPPKTEERRVPRQQRDATLNCRSGSAKVATTGTRADSAIVAIRDDYKWIDRVNMTIDRH